MFDDLSKCQKKNKPHKAWVTTLDGSRYIGILYAANEEILKIRKDDYSTIEFKAADIDRIKIRRINKAGRGALYGALSGLVVGGIVGFAAGDDPENSWWDTKAEEKAIVLAIPAAVIGAGVGALFGTIRKEFVIDGNIVIYNNQLQNLRDYSINPDSLE